MNRQILYSKVNPCGFVCATEDSVGVDLKTYYDFDIKKGEMKVINTGIYINHDEKKGEVAPKNVWYLLKCKSSLALKGIQIEGGVIDGDYGSNGDFKDEIKVIMRNGGNDNLSFKTGDKIVQMICLPYIKFIKPQNNKRVGGFGSTGQK